MDLNAFIRTADPRKVRIVERPIAENERPIVTVAKHRTVTLLPTSVVRSSGELSASVEREFQIQKGQNLILTNPEGAEFTYAMRANGCKEPTLQANVDSRLVANQVNGSYIAKESAMVQYLNKVKTLAKSFKEFSIKQIPRSKNKKADALSKIASTSFAHLNKQVLVEELKEKSINKEEILDIVEEEGNTWMTPIREYLTKEILPEDKKKARAVRRKAAKYAMINGTLYKKSFLGPWLRCVGPLQANYVIDWFLS
ncbi:reverse transcriptase domain-containing protein, partial [Tanacetum coccineum]